MGKGGERRFGLVLVCLFFCCTLFLFEYVVLLYWLKDMAGKYHMIRESHDFTPLGHRHLDLLPVVYVLPPRMTIKVEVEFVDSVHAGVDVHIFCYWVFIVLICCCCFICLLMLIFFFSGGGWGGVIYVHVIFCLMA